jgi:hypothetical protein
VLRAQISLQHPEVTYLNPWKAAGIHTHRIGCPNKDIFDRIRAALEKEGFLV